MKVTVEDVAIELGSSAVNIRNLIDNGELDIATAIINGGKGKRKKYILSPKKIYEETGYVMGGYIPPATIEIDYDKLAEKIVEKWKEAN